MIFRLVEDAELPASSTGAKPHQGAEGWEAQESIGRI